MTVRFLTLLTRCVLIGLAAGSWAPTLPAGDLPADGPYSFHWQLEDVGTNHPGVEVTGVEAKSLVRLQTSAWSPEQWQELFSVYADQGDLLVNVTLPPILGAYRIEAGAIRFEPQFAWDAGVSYRAIFRPNQLPGVAAKFSKPIGSVFRLPLPDLSPTTEVTEVYPSGEEVPENLLKFYLYFSAPMSGGDIYRHIHLQNDAGQDVELPFLEIEEELWNSEMTRLTLIIDPGRIKRGVRPLEEIGPALEAGKRFTLVIDRDWPDSQGRPLTATFRRTYKVGAPDRKPLDPGRWSLRIPPGDGRDPLSLQFGKPLDHALAQRMIYVTDSSGRHIAGAASLSDHECQWSFVPSAPWRSGRHLLVIHATIEDLAGNNVGKSFEVDLFEKVDRELVQSTVQLPFQVR